MQLIENAITLILNTFERQLEKDDIQDEKHAAFKSWIRPLLKKADEELIQGLETGPHSQEVQIHLKIRLKDLLKDEQVEKQLRTWIKLLSRKPASQKNIVEEAQLKTRGDVHIGDKGKTGSSEQLTEKNILRKSQIDTEGAFRLGDDHDLPQPTFIKNQVNIDQNFGPVEPAETKSLPDPTHAFKHGYALIIGVGVDLKGSVNDAKAIYQVLTHHKMAAYPSDQVQLLSEEQATRQGILDALDILIEQAKQDPHATVVIYYSGHGGRRREGKTQDYKYYLLPYDYVQTAQKEHLLAGQLISQKIDQIKAKKLFVLFDCCHAQGMSAKNAIPKKEMQFSSASMIQMFKPGEGRVILASSKDDELSWEVEGKGLFTTSLVEAFKGCNSVGQEGYIHILDVLQYVLVTVPERSKKLGKVQNPVINKIENLDPYFYICHFHSTTAEKVKKNFQPSEREQELLGQSPQQTLNTYTHIKNQVNIHTNQGPINMH